MSSISTFHLRLAELCSELRGITGVRAMHAFDPSGHEGLAIFLCADQALWAQIVNAPRYSYPDDVVQNIAVVMASLDNLIATVELEPMLSEPIMCAVLERDTCSSLGVIIDGHGAWHVPAGDTPWRDTVISGGEMYEWHLLGESPVPSLQVFIVPSVGPADLTDEDALLAIIMGSGWNLVETDDRFETAEVVAYVQGAYMASTHIPMTA